MTEADLADLFERYHRAVHRYFLRVTRRSEDADDLTQDLFVRVSRFGDRYHRQGPGRETVWLFRIALRLVLDRQRKLAGFPVDPVPVEGVGRAAPQFVAFALQEALARVTGLDRHVFALREMVGLTYAEIAEVCDLTEDGVRARLSRVRGHLRALLGGRLSGIASRDR